MSRQTIAGSIFGLPAGTVFPDQLTVEIPESLGGLGETVLIAHVNGRPSNAVRIYLGGETAGSVSPAP